MPDDPAVQPFNRDVSSNTGYLYTTNARLSSVLANQRLTSAALQSVDFRNKRVLDIGCGDGAYTVEIFDASGPQILCGIDPAANAIAAAKERAGMRQITFAVGSSYHLPYESNSFDLAHIRGVLHHLDNPRDAMREALRAAPTVIIIEPNGYNPVLKLLERFSKYHRDHGEKSYSPHVLDQWTGKLGARVTSRSFAGLVPFFFPDALARMLKVFEPYVERLPLFRQLCCAVYVQVARRFGEEFAHP